MVIIKRTKRLGRVILPFYMFIEGKSCHITMTIVAVTGAADSRILAGGVHGRYIARMIISHCARATYREIVVYSWGRELYHNKINYNLHDRASIFGNTLTRIINRSLPSSSPFWTVGLPFCYRSCG